MSDNPKTLPQWLLDLIGEYGMARTDRVEPLSRWADLLAGIKRYSADEARAALAQQAATPTDDLTVPPPMPAPVLAFGSVEQDCFTGDQIAARDAMWSARVAASRQAATPAPAEPIYALLPKLERLRSLTPPDVGSTWEDQYRELEKGIQSLADSLAAPPATPAPAEPVVTLQARLEAAERERDKLRAELSPPGELPRRAVQCFGCEGKPGGKNDPCDVCGRTSADLRKYLAAPPATPAAQPAETADAKLARFGALVIRAHRNDFGINDLDGGELQEHAEAAGVLERREVTEPCGEGCECACACDFPTFCYFLAPDVSDALAAAAAPPEGSQG